MGCGERISLLDLVDSLNELLGTDIEPTFASAQPGDVQHSLAAIDKAQRLLGYRPLVTIRDGLAHTVRWLRQREAVMDGRAELTPVGDPVFPDVALRD